MSSSLQTAEAAHKSEPAALKRGRRRGLFISFEGGEGSGKSTQIQRAAAALRRAGRLVVATREPGGTKGAEALRYILLDAGQYGYSPLLEAILFAAGRRDHIEQVIEPALAAGAVVLCDRFLDSTRVYQGLENKLAPGWLDILETAAVGDIRPDLSFILDIDAKTGMARANKRRGAAAAPDRFEKDSLKIQERRRRAFLKIARAEPQRCRIIAADRPPEQIEADILHQIEAAVGIELSAGAAEAANAAGGGAKQKKEAANG